MRRRVRANFGRWFCRCRRRGSPVGAERLVGREIRNLIEDSTSQTRKGCGGEASALINGMVDSVEEMDVILREIGQASREQKLTVFRRLTARLA